MEEDLSRANVKRFVRFCLVGWQLPRTKHLAAAEMVAAGLVRVLLDALVVAGPTVAPG